MVFETKFEIVWVNHDRAGTKTVFSSVLAEDWAHPTFKIFECTESEIAITPEITVIPRLDFLCLTTIRKVLDEIDLGIYKATIVMGDRQHNLFGLSTLVFVDAIFVQVGLTLLCSFHLSYKILIIGIKCLLEVLQLRFFLLLCESQLGRVQILNLRTRLVTVYSLLFQNHSF